ncbi:CbtB-domain containing protein [Clostridioides sp. ES-S-0010-02]|nr:CbtB-domain containing protein [Clostridioides sp. ES-S-0010-02]
MFCSITSHLKLLHNMVEDARHFYYFLCHKC